MFLGPRQGSLSLGEDMKRFTLFLAFGLVFGIANAQRTPISLTGYNFDGIANGADSSLAGVQSSTTGTLDSIYDYFTLGFDPAAPTVGLPTASFVSAADATTTFLLANPAGNNLLLLQQFGSGATTGTLTLATGHAYTSLALLVTGFNGNQPGGYTLNFSSGPSTAGTFTASDNFNVAGYAINGFGRVSRISANGFDLAGGVNPRLYQITVTLSGADAARTLTSIGFSNNETSGTPSHNIGVFGVSGAAAVPEPASLIALGIGAAALARRRRRS